MWAIKGGAVGVLQERRGQTFFAGSVLIGRGEIASN